MRNRLLCIITLCLVLSLTYPAFAFADNNKVSAKTQNSIQQFNLEQEKMLADMEERLVKAREKLISDFEKDTSGTVQPFGLPPSHAPAGAWDTMQSTYPTYDLVSNINEGLEDLAGITPENSIIVGGYRDWYFFNEEQILLSDGSNFMDIFAPTSRWWFFLLTKSGDPISMVAVDAAGGGSYVVSSIYGGGAAAFNSLKAFAEELSDETLKSPILLSPLSSDSNCMIVADTENGCKAYMSYTPKFGSFDAAGLIGFQQERIRTTPTFEDPNAMGGGMPTLRYDLHFEPMAPRPDPAPPAEPISITGYIILGCALVPLTVGSMFVLRKRKKI